MKIRFWGVRGSVATPGPKTILYGGNTSCVSAELDNGAIVIFDAGTGIRECGNDLMGRGGPIKATILISHTHWDHIQGFPFFVPSYIPGNRFTMFGPSSDVQRRTIRDVIELQTGYEVFPVKVAELGSEIEYADTPEGPLPVEGLAITACRLNHPVPCFAYRLTENGRTFVYGGDHEPFRNVYRDDEAAASEMDEDLLADLDEDAAAQNQKIADFLQDADLVSWDSMYTHEEYLTSKKGWGHSWYETNLALAKQAGVKHLICSHHDPTATDTILAEREATYTAQAADLGLQMEFSREGMCITI